MTRPAKPVAEPKIRVKDRRDLAYRRRRTHCCWDHLLAAPLWPLHGVNLGTLLRTCDAVGACLVVPRLSWIPEALDRGNTLRRPTCVHWVSGDPTTWLVGQHKNGTRILGVELADDAIRLPDGPRTYRRRARPRKHRHPARSSRPPPRRSRDPHDRHRSEPERRRRSLPGPLPTGRTQLTPHSERSTAPALRALRGVIRDLITVTP
jgi:hypothetical protein